jgi:hypothetical protein
MIESKLRTLDCRREYEIAHAGQDRQRGVYAPSILSLSAYAGGILALGLGSAYLLIRWSRV